MKFSIFVFLAAFIPAVVAFLPSQNVLPSGTTSMRLNAMTMNTGADLIDSARAKGCFNTFLKACDDTGLTNSLRQAGGIYTIYMPTDQAFAKIQVPQDRAQLENLVKYHIVKLFVPDEKVIREFRLSNKPTMSGGRVRIVVKANPNGGEQVVEFNRGEAFGVETDIETTNGTIHAIDGVLTPQEGDVIPLK
jgi:uncharacterized surface protein with fasciclin (FAS1) repeats